jgi:autotransporter-associated beta strand protein
MRRTFAFRLFAYCAIVLIADPRLAFAARSAGIDVSDYQGTLSLANWQSIHSDGKDFAWTKATEGGTFTASTFANNMINGTQAGVYMGAYHYAHPESNTAATDAAHFVAVAGPYLTNGHLRPMLDIESNAFTLSTTDLSNWINTFCTYVTDRYGASADPLIYISASPAGSEVNSSVTSHKLDVASYGTNPVDPAVPTGNPSTGVWPTWAFWQYGSQGRVAGIGGGTANVDVDVANGDITYVQSLLIGGTTPPTAFEQFDVNDTTGGSGVTNNGSYTWEAAKFSSSAAGTDPVAWNDGNFLRLAAGTDAAASNYTITANSNHTVAGMMLQTNGGGTVTIDGAGVLSIASGDQGFFVTASTQNLKISAVLGGSGKLVWQGSGSGTGNQSGGSLYLLGNNTYTGGTALNSGSGVNFNNNNSFGTGRITWGYTGGTATQYVLANDVATAPVTLANPVTTQAGATLIYVGPAAAPLTFTGAWTLPSGTSTLTIGNASHTSAKMTISGAVGGSGGALTKSGVGTLVLSGANTYDGTTTISAGTFQLGGGGTTGKLATTSAIINNASLIFNRTNTVAQGTDFTGSAISGTGSLTQAGSGTLTLSAANTYTGKTFANAGTLSVSSDANLGAAPGSAVADQLTFNGGALQVTASFTMSTNRGITLNGSGTINTNGGDLTFNGAMTGSGAFAKSGANTLILGGANSYTGTTTISGGALQLGNGGTTGSLSTASAIINNAGLIFKRSNTVTQGVDFRSGPISGTGSLTQSGSGNLVLNAANTYGATTVQTGTVTVSGALATLGSGPVTVVGTTSGTALVIQTGVANAINDSAALSLAGGGTAGVADQGYASLGAGTDESIGSLLLGLVAQAPGLTYGSTASGAAVQSDEYFSGTGMVSVGLLGDFNGDASVDEADYLAWRKSDSALGGSAGYDLWRANFGATAPGSGSSQSLAHAAVPEPSAMILALVGMAVTLVLRTPRRKRMSGWGRA